MTVWQNQRPQCFLKERIILNFSGVLVAACTSYNETEIYHRGAVSDARKRPGVIPANLRKVVMNWLWLEKPHRSEISTRVRFSIFRSSCAQAMRRWFTY